MIVEQKQSRILCCLHLSCANEDICGAGHQKGMLGTRSSLVKELFRVADECPELQLEFMWQIDSNVGD